jgi:hypothetical protein
MPSLKFLVAAFALAAQAALAQAPSSVASGPSPRVAGKVVLVEGDALHFDRSGALRSLRVGDRIYEGDRLVTGADGDVHLAMGDGGYIGVRPGTELRIDLFRADGGPGDRSEISLIKGSLRTVTGFIGSVGAALIHTFDATIGVRGTDHEPLVVPEGAARGEPGTYDRVNAGATYIETRQGRVELRAGEAGFVPHGLGLPAEVLRTIPNLYRPTRNEGVFAGLNDRIHEQIEKRRAEGAGERDRVERPGTVDRPDRPARPERADRPQRPDKPDHPGRNK